MRRAVSGRSKHFDKLLADHRAAKDAALKLVKTVSAVPGMLSQVKIYRKYNILVSVLKLKYLYGVKMILILQFLFLLLEYIFFCIYFYSKYLKDFSIVFSY
jgi:hypothetical protein